MKKSPARTGLFKIEFFIILWYKIIVKLTTLNRGKMSFERTSGGILFSAVQDVSKLVRKEIERGVKPQVSDKPGYAPSSADITTDFDGIADRRYRELLEPHAPVLSEDGSVFDAVPKKRWCIDAVDGTRSLAAGLSDLVGTMGAAIDDQEAYAAYVVHIMTGEMMGFDRAHQNGGLVTNYAIDEHGNLAAKPVDLSGLAQQFPEQLPVQVRRSSSGRISYSPQMEALLAPGRAFSCEQLVKGSFGVGMFPLWRGKVAAQVIPASYYETPWDNTPVFAICRELGIEALTLVNGRLMPLDMQYVEAKRPGTEILLVHDAFVDDTMRVARVFCRD